MDSIRFPLGQNIASGAADAARPTETRGVSIPGAPGASFGDALGKALSSVNHAQAAADDAVKAWAVDGSADLHTVLLQVEKADLSFRTMMEVRNRLLEAYREVMRMPV